MDSPWVLAIGVFILIYLMFFFISLLADMFILFIALGCAILAFNIPELYPDIVELLQQVELPQQVGFILPPEPTLTSQLTLALLVVFFGTLACIPFLPFSATYRQMLGANKIGKSDELYIRRLVGEEWDRLRKKVLQEQKKRHVPPSKEPIEEEEAPPDSSTMKPPAPPAPARVPAPAAPQAPAPQAPKLPSSAP